MKAKNNIHSLKAFWVRALRVNTEEAPDRPPIRHSVVASRSRYSPNSESIGSSRAPFLAPRNEADKRGASQLSLH